MQENTAFCQQSQVMETVSFAQKTRRLTFSGRLVQIQISVPLGTTVGSLGLPIKTDAGENLQALSAITQLSSAPSPTSQPFMMMQSRSLAPGATCTPEKMMQFSTSPSMMHLSPTRLLTERAVSP